MRVRLTTSRATMRHVQDAETEIDLPDAEARRLIASGQAVPVRDEAVERAIKTAPERAVKSRGARRKSRNLAGAEIR